MGKYVLNIFAVNSCNSDNYKRFYSCGFTLVEIIAVLSIVAVLASLSIPKFMDLSSNASRKVLESAINELNSREFSEWAKHKTDNKGTFDDAVIFAQMDFDLGTDFHWSPKAKIDGGILHFRGQMIKLKRISSTVISAGRWEIIFSSDK